jgi:ribosomal protein S8
MEDVEPYKYFISGFVSGFTTAIATQPIDTIKTRQQIYKLQLKIENKPKPQIYKNVFGLFIKFKKKKAGIYQVFKNEGFISLYKGLSPALLCLKFFFNISQPEHFPCLFSFRLMNY